MKKQTIGLVCLCLLASAGVGASVGMATYAHYNNEANIIMVKAEDAESELESSEDITEEEKSKLQEYIDVLEKKYAEIRDTQIFGTTLGTIIGAVVGAVVSLIPALLNRGNIKKALEEVSLTRAVAESNEKLAKKLQEDYKITNDNYLKVVKELGIVSANLKTTETLLHKLSDENAEIKAENKEMKELMLEIFSHSSVLAALGVSEEVFKKYLSDKTSK